MESNCPNPDGPRPEQSILQPDQALRIAKALADRSRLLILNALRDGDLCAEEVAARLGLAPSTTSFHLKKLADAGLVAARRDQYYAVYSLRPEMQRLAVADLIGFADPQASAQETRTAHAEAAVVRAFFADGRLVRMPAQKRKRRIVLELLAGMFEPGREFAETDVDATIRQVHHDHCLVRRLLVDDGFFTREHGVYRRTDLPGRNPGEIAWQAASAPDVDVIRTQGGDMDARKKALKRDYAQSGRRAGIFRIVNTSTGRSLVGSSLDVRAALNRYRFELEHGSHRNAALQDDFTRQGEDAFAFETVETVAVAADSAEVERELEALEARYAPAGDAANTYNLLADLRVPPKPSGIAR